MKEDILCIVVIAVVGALLGIIAICICMSAGNADADNERMEQDEGFPPVYNRGYSDALEKIRRIVS